MTMDNHITDLSLPIGTKIGVLEIQWQSVKVLHISNVIHITMAQISEQNV